MTDNAYRFAFESDGACAEAEMTLHLAIFAVEGLFGQARVRLEAGYDVDESQYAITIDATTEVGAVVVQAFTGLLLREIGADAFEVRSVAAPTVVANEKAA